MLTGMTMLNAPSTTLPERLRSTRILAGLDQVEIGRLLGVSRPTVSNWERGIYEPSVSQFIAWAQITKQPVDRLIDGLPGCAPWDSNPEPIDYEAIFWAIVEQLEPVEL